MASYKPGCCQHCEQGCSCTCTVCPTYVQDWAAAWVHKTARKASPGMVRPTRQVRPTTSPSRLMMALMRCRVRSMPARLSPPKAVTCTVTGQGGWRGQQVHLGAGHTLSSAAPGSPATKCLVGYMLLLKRRPGVQGRWLSASPTGLVCCSNPAFTWEGIAFSPSEVQQAMPIEHVHSQDDVQEHTQLSRPVCRLPSCQPASLQRLIR